MQKRFKDSMNSVSKLTKKTNTFYYSYTDETQHACKSKTSSTAVLQVSTRVKTFVELWQ